MQKKLEQLAYELAEARDKCEELRASKQVIQLWMLKYSRPKLISD